MAEPSSTSWGRTNVGDRARLDLGAGRTIEAPGTTQALRRSEPVRVELDFGEAATILRPNLVGALIGKACAVAKISSQSAASRAKHLRDFDSLARLLGPHDRATADLSKSERKLLNQLSTSPEMTELGRVAIDVLVETSS